MRDRQGKPHLYLSFHCSLITRGQRSMAPSVAQTQRRSSHANCSCNGRDIQLDQLGQQLIAPTHQKKRRFVPEEGLTLENNALAPAPKKRCAKVPFPPAPSSFFVDQTSQTRGHAPLSLNCNLRLSHFCSHVHCLLSTRPVMASVRPHLPRKL